jgi:hypothetical protein
MTMLQKPPDSAASVQRIVMCRFLLAAIDMDSQFPAMGSIEMFLQVQPVANSNVSAGSQAPTTAKHQTLFHKKPQPVPIQQLAHPWALYQRMPHLVDSALIAIFGSQFRTQEKGRPKKQVYQ